MKIVLNRIPLARGYFQKIIRFYLFECPVRTFKKTKKEKIGSTHDQPNPKYDYFFKKVSKRGVTFADRKIDGSKLNSLRAAMMRVTEVHLIVVDTCEEVIDKAQKLNKRLCENLSVNNGLLR